MDKISYCGKNFIPGGHCSWIVQILLGRWGVISWVTGLLHYNARQFICLLIVRGDLNPWVRITYKINEHWFPTADEDSTVIILIKASLKTSIKCLLRSWPAAMKKLFFSLFFFSIHAFPYYTLTIVIFYQWSTPRFKTRGRGEISL